MFSAETTALLRAVLEEVCENILSMRPAPASKILEAAAQGQLSTDALKAAGRRALDAPTMWR